MASRVPQTLEEWDTLARARHVPTIGLLSDCPALPSGSKFGMEHYLPLRIILCTEKSLLTKRRKFRETYFPSETQKKVLAKMEANEHVQAMREFLSESDNIKTKWNEHHYRAVGPFCNGLEKLHQIASKKESSEVAEGDIDSDEDTTDSKILASSPSARSKPKPHLGSALGYDDIGPRIGKLNLNAGSHDARDAPHTPTPRPRRGKGGFQSYADFDPQDIDDDTPKTDLSSVPDSDLRLAKKEFERVTTVLSDEQTVNMCLENLLMSLSNTMGYYDRIRSDRKAFIFPKDDETHFYQACVDGIIMNPGRQQIMAFMEVKRRLRSMSDAVVRQIGAQMAAFILQNDDTIYKRKPPGKRHMWMVSMECYEAFIIVATYDQEYVDYLSLKPDSNTYDGFMTMVESTFDLRIWNSEMERFLRDVAILMGGPKEE